MAEELVTPARDALILACGEVRDPSLPVLSSAGADALAFSQVLADPTIGGFRTRILTSPESQPARRAVEEFLGNRRRDDLLLLYFSGHGQLDEHARLHLATADTEIGLLHSTSLAADFLNGRMDASRSRRIVVVLDCCYAGAFPLGAKGTPEPAHFLEGAGRAVLASSEALSPSYEAVEPHRGSLFTRALARGLATGAADLDGDGRIEVGELYRYAHDLVQQIRPEQRPVLRSRITGGLVIAFRSPTGLVFPRGTDEWSVSSPDVASDEEMVGFGLARVTPTMAAVVERFNRQNLDRHLEILGLTLTTGWPTLRGMIDHGMLDGWQLVIYCLCPDYLREHPEEYQSVWAAMAESKLAEMADLARSPSMLVRRGIGLQVRTYRSFPGVHGWRFGRNEVVMAVSRWDTGTGKLAEPYGPFEHAKADDNSARGRACKETFENWLGRAEASSTVRFSAP
ncbi:caspase family protein [Nocardia iowensis]|uniref:Caspase family protein n=1 Tax=Nocardia iowensis TaxID=204891 RepID=A0ABX8RYB3_NOCIO|nr:caspase family protein [Nocardia iowensis]QXN94191.1 caspase family protein [Nocardia iowensis]